MGYRLFVLRLRVQILHLDKKALDLAAGVGAEPALYLAKILTGYHAVHDISFVESVVRTPGNEVLLGGNRRKA